MAKQTKKKKRKLLCKDCKRRKEQGQLIGTMVLTICGDCRRATNGSERAFCNDCAEKNGRCTWCGVERD